MKVAKGGGQASAGTKSNPGGDPDGDGIPNTFDADDNGNKTLYGVDPVLAKTDTAGLFSDVQVMMARSVDANAGSSPARRSTRSSRTTRASTSISTPPMRPAPRSPRSTSTAARSSLPPAGDGTRPSATAATRRRGSKTSSGLARHQPRRLPRRPGQHRRRSRGDPLIEIKPNATTADLHAGDLYQLRFTTPGRRADRADRAQLLLHLLAALASYDGGAGTVNIAYPATDSTAGSDGNPLRMTGDSITLRFWRPQRAGLGSEPAYVDMGHLRYGIPISVGSRQLDCGADRFSGPVADAVGHARRALLPARLGR